MPPMTTTAAERWRDALASWAIPEDILAAAPEPPWRFPPALFAARAARVVAEGPTGPSAEKALEVLPEGGSVLDVGVGGGAGSLPLVPPAAFIVGVDEGAELLATFRDAADRVGVEHREVQGSWPAVADQVEAADVVVCHHVFYNIGDLGPFAAALTDHARRRVVVELSYDHPTLNFNPLWKAIHGIERPTSPTADDAVAVLEEMGLVVSRVDFERSWGVDVDRAEQVAMARSRLCVGPERDAEIDALLPPPGEQPPRRVVTLWWEGAAPS